MSSEGPGSQEGAPRGRRSAEVTKRKLPSEETGRRKGTPGGAGTTVWVSQRGWHLPLPQVSGLGEEQTTCKSELLERQDRGGESPLEEEHLAGFVLISPYGA